MQVNINFFIPDPVQILVYLLIGLVVTLIIGGLAHVRSSIAYILGTIFAAIGAWLAASFLYISLGNGSRAELLGVPLLEALLGALIFGLIAMLVMGRPRVVVE